MYTYPVGESPQHEIHLFYVCLNVLAQRSFYAIFIVTKALYEAHHMR